MIPIITSSLLLLVAVHHAPQIDADRFLESVREVAQAEHTALGAYDVSRTVWEQHCMTIPYRLNRQERCFAMLCAKVHLKWLISGLERTGIEPSAYNLGACWLLGLEGGKIAIRKHDPCSYAQRIANIYHAAEIAELRGTVGD
jgi:hypothetical protein